MRHNLPTMAAIDGLQVSPSTIVDTCIVMSELIDPDFELQRLYCTDNPMFAMARSLGLQVVNSNTNLKRFALNQASN